MLFCCLFGFSCCLFGAVVFERVSYVSWAGSNSAENDLKRLIFQPPPSGCWDSGSIQSHLVLYSAGDRTQGPLHAKQAYHCRPRAPSPVCSSLKMRYVDRPSSQSLAQRLVLIWSMRGTLRFDSSSPVLISHGAAQVLSYLARGI